jgi:hypothetical protein
MLRRGGMLVMVSGEPVEPTEPIDIDAVTSERFRDILIVRLRAKNVSLRKIGGIIGITHEAVRKRLEMLPDPVQEYYRNVPLG